MFSFLICSCINLVVTILTFSDSFVTHQTQHKGISFNEQNDQRVNGNLIAKLYDLYLNYFQQVTARHPPT